MLTSEEPRVAPEPQVGHPWPRTNCLTIQLEPETVCVWIRFRIPKVMSVHRQGLLIPKGMCEVENLDMGF